MGAWGTGPWENDSSLDWLFKVEDHVKRALKPALKPLKPQKFHRSFPRAPKRPKSGGRAAFLAWEKRFESWKKRRKVRLVSQPTICRYCQHEALAAVEVVLALPILQRGLFDWRESEDDTYANVCERVLLNLKKDEGFIASWRDPKEYVAVLDDSLRRVKLVVAKQRRERKERIAQEARRIKKMPKPQRDRIAADSGKPGTIWHRDFKEAFKLADGRELQNGPVAIDKGQVSHVPRRRKKRAPRVKRRRRA